MRNVFATAQPAAKPSFLKLPAFHGLNKATKENALYRYNGNAAEVWTHKGVNFWIDNGSLTSRNNYEEAFETDITTDLNDGLTYKIKSMYVSVLNGIGTVLAGVEAYSGETLDHCALAFNDINGDNTWDIAEWMTFSATGTAVFQSANFSCVNYEANPSEAGIKKGGTILTNGIDPVLYFFGGYLWPLNSLGWEDATLDKDTDFFSCAALATNGNAVEIYSTDGVYPAGLEYDIYSQTFYVVGKSGDTFQLSESLGGSAINFTSNGSGLKMRLISHRTTDAPLGKKVMLHNERIWLGVFSGVAAANYGYSKDSVYHSDSYHDGESHAHDFSTANVTGKIVLPTWDGDHSITLYNFVGDPRIVKGNTVFTIEGEDVPYKAVQMFAAHGTIASGSLAYYPAHGLLFYATHTGIQVFNGSSSDDYLTTEIAGMWYPDPDMVCNVVNDTLLVCGKFYHPISARLVDGIVAVHIPTKEICYWDMTSSSGALTVDATIDPWFTTLRDNMTAPEFWFACGAMIYRYSNTHPTNTGPEVLYYLGEHDFGVASKSKHITRITLTGSNGMVCITPIKNGIRQPAKYIQMDTNNHTPKRITMSLSGYLLAFEIKILGGRKTTISDLEFFYTLSQ